MPLPMAGDPYRFQLHVNGSYTKAYGKLVGAKIAVACYARLYREYNYTAIDTLTGETWGWNPERSRLERLDTKG